MIVLSMRKESWTSAENEPFDVFAMKLAFEVTVAIWQSYLLLLVRMGKDINSYA